MKATLRGALVALLCVSLSTEPWAAQALGIFTRGDGVSIFEAESDHIVASIDGLNVSSPCTGLALSPDLRIATVPGAGALWWIDLTTRVPSVARGENPTAVPGLAVDMGFSADGRYLVAVTNGALTVVDVRSRHVVFTRSNFDGFIGWNALEVCPDGSVLASTILRYIVRFELTSAGTLVNTHEAFELQGFKGSSTFDDPLDLFCCRQADTGLALRYVQVVNQPTYGELYSFRIHGMQTLHRLQLGGRGDDVRHAFRHAALAPGEDRVYVRSFVQAEAHAFDPFTGEFGVDAVFTTPLQRFTSSCAGTATMAVHPDGTKLYLTEMDNQGAGPAHVEILDTTSGKILSAFTLATELPISIRVAAPRERRLLR